MIATRMVYTSSHAWESIPYFVNVQNTLQNKIWQKINQSKHASIKVYITISW